MFDREAVMSVVCKECGKRFRLCVNDEDMFDYYAGVKVQFAFSYLTAGERELLTSRICPTCWDSIYNERSTI